MHIQMRILKRICKIPSLLYQTKGNASREGSIAFSHYTMNLREECDLAFALETAYFGTENNKISTDMLIRLGRCFAKAFKRYIEAAKEKD